MAALLKLSRAIDFVNDRFGEVANWLVLFACLISAGNAKELFRLTQTHSLRVFVRVPQTLARAIEPGRHAELTFTELPGRKFMAKTVRTAGAMEPTLHRWTTSRSSRRTVWSPKSCSGWRKSSLKSGAG